jgi:hypothetical protein
MRMAALALLALVAGTAHAQAVYRCGSEYSQKPCAGATSVAADDPRTASEAKQATAQTQRNAKLANQMEKERLAEEKRVAGPSMLVVGQKAAASAPAQAASQSKSGKKKPARKQPADFTAVAPSAKKKSSI